MAGALLTVAEARAQILGCIRALERETVPVQAAAGRVLASEVLAAGPVPPFDSSAMDGYAVSTRGSERILTVLGESRAGHPSALTLRAGTAIRISTGAAIPAGADAVIRQEDVKVLAEDRIELLVAKPPGTNIRGAGEDMAAGQRVLGSGAALGPAHVGVAVGAGAGEVQVFRRPAVAVLCTGDELRSPGERLRAGEIHNSNAPMLTALVTGAGGVALDPVRIGDDPRETVAALRAALEQVDVMLVCGGVSVGPHDHVRPALRALGVEEVFWQVALQPGKPTWFGNKGATLVFGLPGNPVSAVVTFALFVRSALHGLVGRTAPPRRPAAAALAQAVACNPEREQAIRVRLEYDAVGAVARPTGPQGSHVVTSLLQADALAMIPADTGELPAGSEVRLESLWD